MLSIQQSQPNGSEPATRRAAALGELFAETSGRRHAPPGELDEAALLLVAVHPALSRDGQEVLLLRAALWFTPEEIAYITGLTGASVETRLRGAYRRLRSTGIGAPFARVGLLERARRALEILEGLYWRGDALSTPQAGLSQRLHQGVLSQIQVLARQDGPVGGEANALQAFLWLSRSRMGEGGGSLDRGRSYLRAAEEAGASGRYVWLARIISAQLGPSAPDWHRIAVMWEVIHEMDHPAAPRWLGNPLARLAAADASA
jgi:DNA-binding CsgD family transcriptional regulator